MDGQPLASIRQRTASHATGARIVSAIYRRFSPSIHHVVDSWIHSINSPSLTYICCHTLVTQLATNDLVNMIQPESMGSDTSQIVRATVCPLPGALAFLTVLNDIRHQYGPTNTWTCVTPYTPNQYTHARMHARMLEPNCQHCQSLCDDRMCTLVLHPLQLNTCPLSITVILALRLELVIA